MHEQKSLGLKAEKKTFFSAFDYDRDKNLSYLASDESIEEVLDEEGYHVVHANRNLSNEDSKR